ncbi:MAG: ABC transporter ATP-binding protein [Dermatophilaceae bacterium]
MTHTVDISDVTFAYRRRRVLSGASWSIGRGVTALLGPNGAGKTTLIRCIVGLAKPRVGVVRVMGRPVSEGGSVGTVGYVPQRPELPDICRVVDAVEYAAWLNGVGGEAAGGKVTRTLAMLDIADLADRRIRTLSGGQRQRVAIAVGVVHEPAVLILDEPTAGLDPGQRLRVRDAIRRLGAERSVLLSTHLTEDVEHLADSVGVLVGGQVRFSGSVAELAEGVGVGSDIDRPGSAFERGYDHFVSSLERQ